jgi:threonyl-tRNA synthetase
MRMLFVHSGHISWKAKRKSKKSDISDILLSKDTERVDDALVIFVTVEGDDNEMVVYNATNEINKVAEQIKTSKIVLFPFAHLFPQKVCDSKKAIKVLNDLETSLSHFETKHVPFGWYKEFELSSKGHPLSILSKTITANQYCIAEPCSPRSDLV